MKLKWSNQAVADVAVKLNLTLMLEKIHWTPLLKP